ncbi:hypothetical protein SNE40_013384 [Patella caerulea]|uniref:Uncharacterized protein n=1 Tax=Patella caerulea TaxID=87958 RepID=A0AAN8PNF4_PATCE
MVGLHVFEGLFIVSTIFLLLSALQRHFVTSLVLFSIVYFTYNVIRKKTAKFLKTEGKYVLITGCDSGFGLGLAKYLDDLGFNVFATCLHENGTGANELKNINSDRLHVLQMDVGKDESVTGCLQKVEQMCGNTGLWGIVNNAGINFVGDIEFCTMKQYLDIGNVNMYGMVRVTKAFLPLIRQTKGRIVNVTSCKGRIALPYDSAYGITKYGGEAFSDILRLEMKRFGIKTSIIQPGNYGGITGCLNEEGQARIKNDLDIMWNNASEEIREVYGKEYHDSFYRAIESGARTTSPTIQPVLEAFKDALLNVEPETRYLIPGGSQWFDVYCVFGILNGLLPTCIMDKLMDRQFLQPRPLPRQLQTKSKSD